jgi:magnesium-transporting ATPase (P-type)
MTVVVQELDNGRIFVYTKGADLAIFEKLSA